MLDVNEAYTSKTRSWDGTIKCNLGGASVIRDESGFGMDRDVNGARGIFLRALGDSTLPAWLAHAGCIARQLTRIVECCLAFNYRLLSQGDQFSDVEYTLYRGRHARHKHPRGSAPAA